MVASQGADFDRTMAVKLAKQRPPVFCWDVIGACSSSRVDEIAIQAAAIVKIGFGATLDANTATRVQCDMRYHKEGNCGKRFQLSDPVSGGVRGHNPILHG